MADDEAHMKAVFTEMIRAKLGMFRSIAIKIVNSSADADDAVQAALVKSWRRRASFRSDFGALPGWVARIVVTESYDLLRKRMREAGALAEYLPEDGNTENGELRRLDLAIAALPELYRETVHLAILSDWDSEKAAAALGCSVNTLYQRVHKAKALLRKEFGRLDNE